MGDTISSLVFRPPKPTPIHPSDYFYLDVDVHSPLCTNRAHRRGHNTHGSNDDGRDDDQSTLNDGGCFVGRCIETGESDLASLDTSFIGNKDKGCYNHEFPMACSSPLHYMTDNTNGEVIADIVPNVRNGQVYKVPAFFIRRRNATQTILFSHGNAEDLGMMYARMKDLAMVLGVNILAYDYTGYGLSIPGPAHRGHSSNNGNTSSSSSSSEGPSENMIYRNIEAAYRYLTRVRKIPPHKIILYGRSIGSGPACYLAAKTSLNGNPVGGLILHSPFLSVYKVVADLNGLDMGIVGDLFHNEKRARNVRCPTLIIHGREDEVVPFWHAPRLLAAIPPEFRAAPYYVDNMGHNHIESRCREKYVKVVLNFLSMGVSAGVIGPTSTNNTPASPSTDAIAQAHYRGPTPVPMNERASISETAENTTFYVNKTWLRHAKVLLRDVLSDVGCHVNNTDWDDCKTRNTGTTSRSKNSGGGTSRRASSISNDVSGGVTGITSTRDNKSDARDDNDEFAPWRSGENHHPKGWQQPQQKQPQLSPESVLMKRSNNDSNVSNNNMMRSSKGAESIMAQFTKHGPSSPIRRVTMPFQKRY